MITLLIIISFVIGSIPTGLLIAQSKGIDLRKVGSGNIGATNVMRASGKKAAVLTLLGDIAKGAAVVGIAKTLPYFGFQTPDLRFEILHSTIFCSQLALEGIMGISVILGHNFSLFLKFKGGKGVATSIGVLLVFSPYAALFTVILWFLVAIWTKYSSLSALVSFGLLPLNIYIFDYSKEKIIIAVAITILIFLRHTPNIKHLIKGTENKMGGGN